MSRACSRFIAVLVAAFVLPTAAAAAGRIPKPGRLGVGIELNRFTAALAGKYFLDKRSSIQAGIGGDDFGRFNLIYLHADYVRELVQVEGADEFVLPLYAGFGAAALVGDTTSLAARGVFGVSFEIRRAPIDVFVQVSPTLLVTPDVDLTFDSFEVGARFFF